MLVREESATDHVPVDPAAQVRTYYRLVDDNDVAGLVGLFAEDAVYHRPGYPALRGHDALRGFYRDERVIERGRHELETVLVHGSRVGVHGTFRGVLRDGREVSLRFADFFELTPAVTFARRDTFFFAPMV